jgi:hypothetical protein
MSTKKSEKQLEEMLAVATDMVPEGSLWRHYKGNDYCVDCIAFDEETLEFEVIYHPKAHPNIHFSRLLSVWLETVAWKEHTLPRFEHLLSLD